MPSSTRATKRRKLSSDSSERARLNCLNDLPTASFQRQHIPPEWLLFRRSGGTGSKNGASSASSSKQEQEQQHALAFYSARSLPTRDFRRCFALLRETSEAHYRRSARGWDAADKKVEMLEGNMRYLIVRSGNTSQAEAPLGAGHDVSDASEGHTPPYPSPGELSSVDGSDNEDVDDFGFLSFMLDEDDDVPDRLVLMLYVYEVHLGRNLRGIGLGQHLMKLAEHVARSTKMHKVELSVHSSNEAAEKFYRRLGFETDETSPSPRVLRGRKSIRPEWCVLSLPVSADEREDTSHLTVNADELLSRPRKTPKRIKPTLLPEATKAQA
jgi:GNAT superfamily N-acetyltransferase